jgi:putative phage-type endonuclease
VNSSRGAFAPHTTHPAPPAAHLVTGPDITKDEWLAIRQRGIGASEIAAIAGFDQYRSAVEVYHDKRGEYTRDVRDFVKQQARLGQLMEPVIAQLFAERSGHDVASTGGDHVMYANDERPWMLATLDYVALYTSGPDAGACGPLECKTRTKWQMDQWAGEAPPVGPYLQNQWQMAVTGWSVGYVAAVIGGEGPHLYRIERNDEMIAGLIGIAEEFRARVAHARPPAPDDSEALAGFLSDRWRAPESGKTVDAPATAVNPWLQVRARAKAAIEEHTSLVREAENNLKTIMGDAEILHVDGRKVATWKANKNGVRSFTVPKAAA